MDRQTHALNSIADTDAIELSQKPTWVAALQLPTAGEIITIPVQPATLGDILTLARAEGSSVVALQSGELAIRLGNGGTIILQGAEGFVAAFPQDTIQALAVLNSQPAELRELMARIASGEAFASAVRPLQGEIKAGGEPLAAEDLSDEDVEQALIALTGGQILREPNFAPLGKPVPPLTTVQDETTRWGRDDIKRGEMGSAGQTLTTGVGTGMGHLTGLADEEIGRRNGEKVYNFDNSLFPGEISGVGTGIDHLWLLGDFDYVRATRDIEREDDDGVFPVRDDPQKVYGPLTDGSDAFALIEDNGFTGRLFPQGLAGLPLRNIVTTIDPTQGSVVLNPDGSFNYTPPPNYSGVATFTYSFTDPRTGLAVTGTVELTVAAVADAPLVLGSATTNEDTPVGVPVTIELRDNDGSEEFESVVISGIPAGTTLTWDPAYNGIVTVRPDGSIFVQGSLADMQAMLASLELTPPTDYHGQLTFNVAVTSIEANVDPSLPGFRDRATTNHTYTINVIAVADPVSAIGDTETTPEDTAVLLNDLGVTFGDTIDGSEIHRVEIRGVDPDAKLQNAAGVEYGYVTAPDGTKTYTIPQASLGSVYFLPPPDESGTFAGMTIVAIATEQSNGDQETASAPITVTVMPVADPVEITAPTQATNEDTPVTFGDDIDIVVQDPVTQDLTEVVISGFPPGTRVQYDDVNGNPVDFIVPPGGATVTLGGGATEAQIRAALATLSLTPPLHTDQNITLTIAATTTDLGNTTNTQTVPMVITVAAVADGPTISGAASGNEDQPIALPVTVTRIDADGSESYEYATVTVPTGVTLTYTALPFGITATAVAGGFTFTPGATTTAAQFQQFLANNLRVQAPADSDVNFNATVTVGTIESTLSGGEVAVLRASQTATIPVTVNPVIDAPVFSGSSTVNEDGIVNVSNQGVVAPVNFGANIGITNPDSTDSSERITQIVVSGLPVGAIVTYTPVGGASTTFTVTAGTTSITLSGGTEADIRSALATLSLIPPPHADQNITLGISVTKTDATSADPEATATQTFNGTHTIAVAAVADGPSITGSASGNEDQPIALPVTVSRIDADGSEAYEFATVTVPTGVTLTYTALPFGITATPVTGGYTFAPGAATTAAQFEQFLANNLRVQAAADSDLNFNATVTVGTIESTLSGGEVTLLRNSLTATVPVTVNPVVDAPVFSGSSSVNEDGIVNVSNQGIVAAVNFGANIGISATDATDGSERITQIVVTGLPVGAVVTYTPVGGASTTFTVTAGTTSITLSGGTEADIRTALATLSLIPPPHRDGDIALGVAVTKTDANTTDTEATATQTFNGTHVIRVAAVADVPTGSGSGAGNEDENIPVSITVGHADNTDGSEKIKDVVIGNIPAGFTLSESSIGLGVLTLNGNGTYTVTGPTDAAIADVLANLTLVIDPAPGAPRQHLDTDFNLSVTVTTIENAPSETGVGQVALAEASTTFNVPITVTAVADGVTFSGSSVLVEDVAKTIGSDIQFTRIDNDGTETVSTVTIAGFPAGTVVTYTDVGGNLQSFTATGTAADTITLTGGTEAQIRTALNTLNATPPPNSDVNFSLTINVTTTDNDGSTITQPRTHTVNVQAVADAPTVTATNSISLNEDATATLNINPGRSVDSDNSETLSVRITVPQDGSGPIGTLSGTGTGGVTFADQGNGVYLVTATGATAADRETALDTFLNGGVTFTPRAQWSGVLSGTNGIRVDAISTEAANGYGTDLAPNNNAGAGTGGDLDTKIETATTYIGITVAPINDIPVQTNTSTTVNENNNSSNPSDPDLVIAIGTRLGFTIADTDGSQSLSMSISGFPTNVIALAFGASLAGVTTNVNIATGTVTITGASANDVLTVLNSLSVTLADDDDRDFTLAISGTSTDTNGVSTVNDNFSTTHQVTVLAVADTPTVDVGATTKAAVDEDSGFVTYAVTTGLNDTDSSETYQSVTIDFSTPGAGSRPDVQFGVTAGVTFDTSTPGRVVLTGSAAAIDAAMASLQVRPGADNGEDITVTVTAIAVESNPSEDNNGVSPGNGGGVAGPQISVPTATNAQSFVIPVTPVPEVPTLTAPPSASGTEDTRFALGAITITSGSADPDGSETRFLEIDTTSFPVGTEFFSGAAAVGTIVTPGWLRIPESALANIEMRGPTNFSGVTTLSVRGVIVDTTQSGSVTSVTAAQPLGITVQPVADPAANPARSTGVEDNGAIAFGADLANPTTGLRVSDNGSGAGNNSDRETITQVMLAVPADTPSLTYTIAQGTATGSAVISYNAGTNTYTITSTIITSAPDLATLSLADRQQAEADIRATLNGFTVTVGPTHNDVNGVIQVTTSTLDVNNGVSSTQSNSYAHEIRIQAVADTPSVSVTNPAAVSEDGSNILLIINAGRSADDDDSEILSVLITVPSDALGPIGTIVGTPPSGVLLTDLGGGVYRVEAIGATPLDAENALDSFLNGGGIAFNPRDNWSGTLTGANGIRVDAISTERETGAEVAPGSFGGADGTSQTETVTAYIDITVTPVADRPTVKGNGVGREDTLIPVPMSVTLADRDGSETYTTRITSIVPSGTRVFGAGGAEIFPDGGGAYNLTPADVSVLSVRPPLNYSSALSGDIQLAFETTVTDTTSGGTSTTSFSDTIIVEVVGVADVPGTRTVTVNANEDEQINLGPTILASAGGNLNNLLVDQDGSEALSFVVGGLPAGVIPTSSVADGVTYLGNGTWSITAAAMPTLQLPPVTNFSGENPYSNVTVRAVTQEIDGDQATSANWPVTITVSPIINSATVDGFASWAPGVTRTEGILEGGGTIAFSSVTNFTLVDNDGSEQVISYTFDLSALIANAGIASQLASLPGAGTGLDKLVATYLSGTFTYNSANGTVTVLAANINGVALSGAPFLNSNQDFAIPVTALLRDTAIIGGTPVIVDKTESGSLGVNLVGTADVPTAFATSTSGNAGAQIPVTLGGASTDTDVGLGRPLSEGIYYVVSLRNGGTAPAIGFTDGNGNIIGLDNGDGTWIFTPAEIATLNIVAAPGSNGTAELRITTIATENDGDVASNFADFQVGFTAAGGTTGTPPLPPTVVIGANSGDEDGAITLNVTATPAPGDTTNPNVAVMISNLPAGTQVIGAIFNPSTGRWVASAAAVNAGLVKIIPPADFSGTLPITIEAVATNANLQRATTGQQVVGLTVDPVADGVNIGASPDAGIEDQPVDLNITLAERDIDGSEDIGTFVYVRANNGATIVGGYSLVAGGDSDATINGTNLVGYYRVPSGDVANLQVQPASNWHGTIAVDVVATSIEPLDNVGDPDRIAVSSNTFNVNVAADADAPIVTASNASGIEDSPIMLTGLSATLADNVATNGAEVLSVKISGVPFGSTFNAGSNNGDGSWTIPVASLATLSITPPLNYSGTMTLSLTAISLELSNGDEAQTSVPFNVVVAPRADTVEILARDLVIDSDGSSVIDMNVRMADNTGIDPGENPREQIRITFTNVPVGLVLVAGAGGLISSPSAGTFEFIGNQEQANAILVELGATSVPGSYAISLSAVTIDGANTLATPVTDQFIVTVPAVQTGTGGANTLTAAAGGQTVFGLGGNDTINGSTGDDRLDGGTGSDTMAGGQGNDIYVVDNASDTVTELAGGGIDTIHAILNAYTLGANIEHLAYRGNGNFTGTGNTLNNTISGGTGNDTLDGGTGNDTLIGGNGSDIYIVDSASDIVVEAQVGGTDLIRSTAASFTLSANVENLELLGTSAINGTGNALANSITGNSAANIIRGGAGADILTGGGGVDTFAWVTGDNTGGTDTISDFVNGVSGDRLDISALLAGFTGSSILSDFVQRTEAGGNTTIRVDVDGAANGASFVDLVVLQGVTGTDLDQMRTNNNLIV